MTTAIPFPDGPIRVDAPGRHQPGLSAAIRHPARLTALRRLALLDTPAEQAFDRLTRLAAKILHAPVALLSLVDGDRSFFKSSVGLPEHWASRREMPLSHSVCQHVVALNAPLVVNDARAHPLVSDNQAVAELRIVAYLGIPLVTSEGHALGTIAVIDTVPREWAPEDVTTLGDLAASAMTEIELRAETNKRLLVEQRLQLLESVVGNATTAVLIAEADPAEPSDPRIVFVNDAYTRLTGYARDEVVGKTHQGLSGPETDRSQADTIRRALAARKPAHLEFLTRRKDGSAFWVELNIVPIADLEGKYSHWVVVQRDVSGQKASEEALRESEARLRAVLESALDCIITFDDRERVLEFNPAAEKTFGYSRADVVGKPLAELIVSPLQGGSQALGLTQHLTGGTNAPLDKRLEVTAMRADGATFPAELAFTAIRPEGPVYTAFLRDIGERKRAEEMLKEANQELEVRVARRTAELQRAEMDLRRTGGLLQAVADETTDAVYVKDRQGRYLLFNEAACRFVGKTAADVLGRDDADLFDPEGARLVMGRHRRVMETGRAETEEEVLTAAGVTRTYLSMKAPYRDARGAIIGTIGISRDITDRKLAEEALHLRDRVIQAVTQGILITDPRQPDNPITYASPGFEQITGYAAAEAVGRNCRFLQGPDTDASTVALVREALREARPCSVEILNYRKDGTPFWNALSVSPVRDADGTVTHFVEVQADVTERKKSEASLARLATIVESSEDAISSVTPDGIVVIWNPGAERLLGYSAGEMVGHGVEAFIPPEHRGADRGAMERVLRGEHVASFEAERRHRDGRTIHASVTLSAVRDAGGRTVGVSSICRDIGPQKAAEEALRLSEEQFHGAFNHAAVGMALVATDGRWLQVNRSVCEIVGYAERELLGMTFQDITHPDDLEADLGHVRELLAGENHHYNMEKRCLHRDGRVVWVMLSVSLVRDAQGRPVHFISQVQDITDRKRMEEGLRLFRALIDQTMDGIEVIDPETGRFLDMNERTCVAHGYTREEYLSLSVPDVDPDIGFRPWGELIAERRLARVQSLESQHRRKDGSRFPVEVILNFIRLDREYLVAVVRDITERRLLEEQLRQGQKMEAVGQLASGVAHDFNNLLQVITGYGELLLGTLRPDDPSLELVREMTRAGERAAGLTRQLLAFSRQSVLAPKVLVLNSVVVDLEKLLRRAIGEDIDLRTKLQSDLGRVKADPGLIEQVVLNLAVNARDAMPQGGKLTIETRDVELDQEYARLHADARPGPYVLLAVSDTGHGMTPEVQARIFEPFFTTKEKGKGTGLGLATVLGVVQQAGGHVAVYSEPGAGTSFKVYLPRVEETASTAGSPSGVLAAPTGTETVLLVEDEDAVRSLVRIVLQGTGYRVLEVSDGREGLAVAARHEGPIHLLLTDVVMPVLGGRQLAEQLLVSHPEMKVLFQSGYTDDSVVRHGVLQERVHFLQKPYSPAALAMKIREVLDAPESSDALRTIPI